MIHAYNKSYLNNAKKVLGEFFDYAINDCEFKPKWITTIFLNSGVAQQFERGNPMFLVGVSGVEMLHEVVKITYDNKQLPKPTMNFNYSQEYWAGWALAQYQWYSAKRFKDIFDRIDLTDIIEMYPLYHEMDISHFIKDIDEKYNSINKDIKLKSIRENIGMSQSELATLSGINIRTIRSYEQKDNHIDKAQAHILYKLSRALGCNVEDLLEDPMD